MIQTITLVRTSLTAAAINGRLAGSSLRFLWQGAVGTLVVLSLVAASGTARPVEMPQTGQAPAAAETPKGIIQGIVMRTGAFDPIPNAQITLVPVADAATPLASRPHGPEAIEDLFTALEPLGIRRTQMLRAAPLSENRVVQNLNDTALMDGVALLDTAFIAIKRQFRVSLASFKGVSDAAGRFTMAGIPPGTYTICAERESYFGVLPDGTSSALQTKTVTVLENQTVSVELSLTQGATVSGRILDGNDQPLAKAFVQALRITYQHGYPVLQMMATSLTDDRGYYRLFWLSGAEYQISVRPPRPAGGIAFGGPTPADAQPMRTFYPGTANFADAGSLAVRTGSAVEGIDFTVRSAKPVKLSGVIHSTVGPAAGASTVRAIVLMLPHDSSAPDNTGTRNAAYSQLDPSTGTFTINDVLPGVYDLYARVPDPNRGTDYGAITVNVRDEDITGLSIDLYPNLVAAGMVRLEDGGTVDPNVRIGLLVEGSLAKLEILIQSMQGRPRVRPGADGSFRVPTTGPGVYRIEVLGLPPQQYVRNVRQGGADVFDSGFIAGSQPLATLEVILSSGAGSVSGAVRNASGNSVGGAIVALVPILPKRLNRTLYQRATSDTDGRFSMRSIAPGDYKLFAWESIPEGAYFDAKFLARYEPSGKSVRIDEAGVLNTDLNVIPGSLR